MWRATARQDESKQVFYARCLAVPLPHVRATRAKEPAVCAQVQCRVGQGEEVVRQAKIVIFGE